jgi:hypothetical protein
MTTEHPGTRHPKAPNLLGIGCAKCGTTSLAKLLAAHADVSCTGKEIHFFDRWSILQDSFINYIGRFEAKPWRMDFDPYHSWHLSHFSKGLYFSQLSHWFELFDREQFTLLILENPTINPQKEISNIEEVLGMPLDPTSLPKLNSQADDGLYPEDYTWLWEKYQKQVAALDHDLGLDVPLWHEA